MDVGRTVLLFPALREEPSKLKSVLEAGWSDHAYRRRRRLPWQAVHHQGRPNLTWHRPGLERSSSDTAISGVSGGVSNGSPTTTTTAGDRKLGVSSYCMGDRGRGERDGAELNDKSFDASCSTTITRKTMGSLSSSVYDELQPFRLAHQELIKRWGLSPREFRAQLQISLHVFLRPTEGSAVAKFFDPDSTGHVNGQCFVRWFLMSGNKYREDRLARQAAERDEEQRQQREVQREERARRDAVNRAAIAVKFSKADEEEGLAVLARVALSYHDQRTGRDAAQREFACALAPDDFREQLHLSFGIRLTDAQFSSLFSIMDTNGDGYIDGAEFLHFFFGLGNEERAKEQRQHDVNYQVRARKLRLDNLPPIAPILGR